MHLFLLTVYLTVLFFPAVVVLLYGIFLGAKFIYKAAFGNSWRIQIRSATPMDSMNEGGMLRTVDQQLSIHGQW